MLGKATVSIISILLALIGLFLAAGTKDAGMALDGFLFFAFGVAVNFWLIARIDFSPKAPVQAAE